MKIQNQSATIKKVKNLRRVSYKRRNGKGKPVDDEEYVEYIVLGNNSTWKSSMPLGVFRKLNPDVRIK